MSSADLDLSGDSPRAPSYHVPALEKGLDILECLAAQGVPLTQAQIARSIGRGANELFRMLTTLERRGYIRRDPLTGAYGLTLRLFELSHTHTPLQGLLRAAAAPMRALTEATRESCHLSVIEREHLVVLAQEESPARIRLSVEVGGAFPLLHTVSGRVLLAYLDEQARADLLEREGEHARLSAGEQALFRERLLLIRSRGYDASVSETTDGVSDLAVLVGSPTSRVRAALTIAALTRRRETFVEEMLPALRRCADEIARAAGII
ncbi:MAG TPA: IclR family transcriptional regulator [Roseiflexaceae bacterium]|nr:IclR family transcriptional regulator [Roseiflexaceae bacterium]